MTDIPTYIRRLAYRLRLDPADAEQEVALVDITGMDPALAYTVVHRRLVDFARSWHKLRADMRRIEWPDGYEPVTDAEAESLAALVVDVLDAAMPAEMAVMRRTTSTKRERARARQAILARYPDFRAVMG